MVSGYAFTIVALIIIFIALIVFVADTWYWSQIYFGATTNMPVSQTTAGILLAFNAIMAVIMLLALIYAIYVLSTAPKKVPTGTFETVQRTTLASGTPLDTVSPSVPVAVPVGTGMYRISTRVRGS